MKFLFRFLVAAGLLFGLAVGAQAEDKAAEAKAMVKKAIAYYQEVGKDKALPEFSNPKGKFVKGEIYIWVTEEGGTNLAHGANAKLIGKNLGVLKDSDGKEFVKELMVQARKGGGWVEYKWTNPVSKKIEPKMAYMERLGKVYFCSGYYK